MRAHQSPIRRRRQLGIELRRHREAAGLTGDQVVERVGWASASKLSRLENGKSRPEPQDINALLDVYEVTEAVRQDLMQLIAESSGGMRDWLKSYDMMTPRQRQYAELEAGCTEIREYSPVVIPGLLQTREYARLRFVSSRPLARPDDIEKPIQDPDTEVQARVARQSVLEGQPVVDRQLVLEKSEQGMLRYTAVLEEATVLGPAGPPEVMRAQVVRLHTMATLPHVTIRVLPRDRKVRDWFLPHTGFSLYRFSEPDEEMGAIEGLSRNFVISDGKELSGYKMVFEWLEAAALSGESTLTWLAEAVDRVAGGLPVGAPARGPAIPPPQRNPHAGRLTEQ